MVTWTEVGAEYSEKRVAAACTQEGEPTEVIGTLDVGSEGMRNQIVPEMMNSRVATSLVHICEVPT